MIHVRIFQVKANVKNDKYIFTHVSNALTTLRTRCSSELDLRSSRQVFHVTLSRWLSVSVCFVSSSSTILSMSVCRKLLTTTDVRHEMELMRVIRIEKIFVSSIIDTSLSVLKIVDQIRTGFRCPFCYVVNLEMNTLTSKWRQYVLLLCLPLHTWRFSE